MSIQIVSLGNEDNGLSAEERTSNVFSFYLGLRSNRLQVEKSHPVFRVYQASVLGNVEIVVHECPDWDTFASDLQRSQATIAEGDIFVLKFAVNNKSLFLEIKNNFAPLLKQIFSHQSVPVIILAIGTRQSDGPSCTCPMCTSDTEVCVPASEGIQLAKDLGATYIELHALNVFYVVKYFGGLLEYFILQTMSKTSAAAERRKKNQALKVKPPKLGPPGAFQWQLLEYHLNEKLKDAEEVAHVYTIVQRIIDKTGTSSHSMKPLPLWESLGFFFNNTSLADVIFQVQDTKIPAHRAMLVARCEVMAAMFSGSYMEANQVLIPVYGLSKDTFLDFLEYIYTDTFYPASILQAMSLLICSEMYQVSRLQHICERYISTQLQSVPSRELGSTSLNVVSLLKKAKFHNSESLYTWLLYFVATHYLIFSQKQEFQDLSAEELDFVERHKWPSSSYLTQLAEYRKYINSPKHRCAVM
ncbi:rho-related BTB domain-containing protein 3 isoform X3 [Hyla sarda]|uniref:rho-related BTB domain-containing protein 3 isoform X3 n=1 Tax=Hyla sarda TaxID=327740 RepID=UPI0024C45DCA|nr:rho-related BTB domain-containing protein 3 isoform X3 [Hyla sarda]